jgi:HK97 family phage prohead protease
MSATETRRPDTREVERRAFALEGVEIRAEPNDDGSIRMSGYAAVFNSRSVVMWDWSVGSFVEEVDEGAFAKTIQEADVRLLINHDPNLILARTRSDTLRLKEDATGLKVTADMAPTTYAQDVAISMKRGDITQMSFAFRTIRDEWAETEDGMPLRRLLEVALSDTSIVTYPAYLETQASARSVPLPALIDALGLQEVAEAERNQFIHELIHQQVSPERLPVLRAARQALDTRIASVAPHEQHATVAGYEHRYRALAALYGLGGHDGDTG